jgi:hypothetical protein
MFPVMYCLAYYSVLKMEAVRSKQAWKYLFGATEREISEGVESSLNYVLWTNSVALRCLSPRDITLIRLNVMVPVPRRRKKATDFSELSVYIVKYVSSVRHRSRNKQPQNTIKEWRFL